MRIVHPIAFLLLGASLLAGTAAHAAEGFSNCTGFIDSVPTSLSQSGVWCLRHDLATSQTAGAAISIAASNVTLDCNDYKIGGLQAGPKTTVMGVLGAEGRQNLTVRRCNLRGFHSGIRVPGAGAVIEDNRVDGSTSTGILVQGDGAVVRGNIVSGTKQPDFAIVPAFGIVALGSGASVVDNDVHDIDAGNTLVEDQPGAVGIRIAHGIAQANRISDLTSVPGNPVAGIVLESAVARNNDLYGNGLLGTSISGDGENLSICNDNRAVDFTNAVAGCASTGNVEVLYGN